MNVPPTPVAGQSTAADVQAVFAAEMPPPAPQVPQTPQMPAGQAPQMPQSFPPPQAPQPQVPARPPAPQQHTAQPQHTAPSQNTFPAQQLPPAGQPQRPATAMYSGAQSSQSPQLPQTPPTGQPRPQMQPPQGAPVPQTAAQQGGQMRLAPQTQQTSPPSASPTGPPPTARPPAAQATPPTAPPAAPPTARQPGQGSAGQRIGSAQASQENDLDIIDALRRMAKMGASDLHLTAGSPPMVRLDGKLAPLADYEKLEAESLQRALFSMITQAQREKFEENLELDFSRAIPGEARFRVNMYRQRDAVGAVFRLIPFEIKPLESLGIPEVVAQFADLPRGLVLVTGPTGSGKSTTLASLIDLANRNRAAHIVTVEDPIEFLHKHKRSLVNQREVGSDTHSFGNALRHVLRQDPDIILIGELRDLETISVALTAAETGHLVFATLHTQDAAQTIDRMIDVFPAGQQGQIRTQLATAIQGVVCQTLLRRGDGPGRAVAVEVMMATPAIRNLIREGKTHQIYTALQAGSNQGMQSMDQHLAELVKAGTVPYDVAAEVCHSVEEFNRLSGRHGN